MPPGGSALRCPAPCASPRTSTRESNRRTAPVGLITYMRTDSTRIAPEALEEVRAYIAEKWGASELPAKPNVYRTKKNAQDAHEAIRPASMSLTPADVKPFLTPEQYKLYTLIWNRFVASQMKPSESTVVTVTSARGITNCGPVPAGSIIRDTWRYTRT